MEKGWRGGGGKGRMVGVGSGREEMGKGKDGNFLGSAMAPEIWLVL